MLFVSMYDRHFIIVKAIDILSINNRYLLLQITLTDVLSYNLTINLLLRSFFLVCLFVNASSQTSSNLPLRTFRFTLENK